MKLCCQLDQPYVSPIQQNRVTLIHFLSDESKITCRLNQAGYAHKSGDELWIRTFGCCTVIVTPWSDPPPKSASGSSALSASAENPTTILPKDSMKQVLPLYETGFVSIGVS
jgi:hypothetical protein